MKKEIMFEDVMKIIELCNNDKDKLLEAIEILKRELK